MTWIDWYNSLAKPSWTPSPSTINLIWMILYPVIVVSFGWDHDPKDMGGKMVEDHAADARVRRSSP